MLFIKQTFFVTRVYEGLNSTFYKCFWLPGSMWPCCRVHTVWRHLPLVETWLNYCYFNFIFSNLVCCGLFGESFSVWPMISQSLVFETCMHCFANMKHLPYLQPFVCEYETSAFIKVATWALTPSSIYFCNETLLPLLGSFLFVFCF